MEFRPNWVSAPGETIRALLDDRGISISSLATSLSIQESDFPLLLEGKMEISAAIAKRLSESLGSTARFWIERDKQYRSAVREKELAGPELVRWANAFPVKQMVSLGWMTGPSSKREVPVELLEYFGVSNLAEWKEEYQSRLQQTQFRTSQSFENDVASTTAWIRHGELTAEAMNCGKFNKAGLESLLPEFKQLTLEKSPKKFIPALQQKAARHGVAVVVSRCAPGCSASGATYVLESGTALLLLSGRFLSDDHFWFSFFHEVGHLVLHSGQACVEVKDSQSNKVEDEANAFAESVILAPEGQRALVELSPNKFSIARFAKRCEVSAGVIVGQLQHRNKIGPQSFNRMKTRYSSDDFIPENVRAH